MDAINVDDIIEDEELEESSPMSMPAIRGLTCGVIQCKRWKQQTPK